jgi:CysZ protein
MLRDAFLALTQVLSASFRRILVKCIGLTILLLIVAGFALDRLLAWLVETPYSWLDTVIGVVAGLGLVVAAIFLVPPVTILVAGLYVDEVAALVEARHYPGDPPGRPLPTLTALRLSGGFFLVVLAVNLIALVLLLLPGVNLVVFFLANAYLLSREYFELAALRFRSPEEARAMRRANAAPILVAGFILAALVAIPIVNLLTPLFGTAFMVHVHKRISGSRPIA